MDQSTDRYLEEKCHANTHGGLHCHDHGRDLDSDYYDLNDGDGAARRLNGHDGSSRRHDDDDDSIATWLDCGMDEHLACNNNNNSNSNNNRGNNNNNCRGQNQQRHRRPSKTMISSAVVRHTTKLLLLVALLFSSIVVPVESGCNYSYSYKCRSVGGENTHTISFTANDDNSRQSSSTYVATVTWNWDTDSDDGSAFDSVTDTFNHHEEISLVRSHVYDQTGTYNTRFSLQFGDGTGYCEGSYYEQTGQLSIGSSSCDYGDSLTSLTQKEAPTPPETNFPLITPSPTTSPNSTPDPVTSSPTKAETDPPTNPPTNPPTTRAPTKTPTNAPTKEPTDEPTSSPTTPEPSRSPVEGPQPTDGPSISPDPTPSPTIHPTVPPSPGPTDVPTTANPTRSPNTLPTTDNPTQSPNSLPTTPAPITPSPTIIPERIYRVPTSMTFHALSSTMQGSNLSSWVRVTKARIRTYSEQTLTNEGEDADVVDVEVELENVQQQMLEGDAKRRLRLGSTTGGRRYLQLDNPLQVNYTSVITFRSIQTNYNPSEMVAAGFRSPTQQEEYIYSLKASNSNFFKPVESFTMAVDGNVITEEGGVIPPINGGGGDGGDSGYTMYYAIGGAAGGACLCILLIGGGYFIKKKRRAGGTSNIGNSKKLEGESSTAKASGTTRGMDQMNGNFSSASNFGSSGMHSNPGSAPTHATSYFGTIESREGEDDVSTLGDPYFGEAIPTGMVERDETVAESSVISSEGERFVYNIGRSRLDTGGASSKMDSTTYTGTTSNRMQHLFGDDDTLENMYNHANAEDQQHIPPYELEDSERITVVAPAGKLGIVIDNPLGEIPVVHAIKETSVLHGRVNVGDLLLSVDEQDCRGMSAVAVSKLISSRSENPTRTLVLLRGSGMVS